MHVHLGKDIFWKRYKWYPDKVTSGTHRHDKIAQQLEGFAYCLHSSSMVSSIWVYSPIWKMVLIVHSMKDASIDVILYKYKRWIDHTVPGLYNGFNRSVMYDCWYMCISCPGFDKRKINKWTTNNLYFSITAYLQSKLHNDKPYPLSTALQCYSFPHEDSGFLSWWLWLT